QSPSPHRGRLRLTKVFVLHSSQILVYNSYTLDPSASAPLWLSSGLRQRSSMLSASFFVLSSISTSGIRATISSRRLAASSISARRLLKSPSCHSSVPAGRAPLSDPSTGTLSFKDSKTDEQIPSVTGVRMYAKERLSSVRNVP